MENLAADAAAVVIDSCDSNRQSSDSQSSTFDVVEVGVGTWLLHLVAWSEFALPCLALLALVAWLRLLLGVGLIDGESRDC